MINGLGVLGWGVGGIEAEAAMLGQPMSMLIPQVVGFKLTGALPEGATATDLVLTVTEMLRKHGVVGQVRRVLRRRAWRRLPLADRATIGNMSPEFGSTCAIFPIDAETLRYLEFSGRPRELIELVEAYAKEQGLWHDEDSEEPTFTDQLELDLADGGAEHRRPQAPAGPRLADRVEGGASGMALEGYLPDEDDEDEAIAEQLPGQRSGLDARAQRRRPRARTAAPAAPRSPSADSDAHAGHARGRDRDRARPRPRRDRRDHELHQHVEPVGDARRRASWRATRSRRA